MMNGHEVFRIIIKFITEQRPVCIKFIVIHRSTDNFRFKQNSEAH